MTALPPNRPGFVMVAYHPATPGKGKPLRLVGVYEPIAKGRRSTSPVVKAEPPADVPQRRVARGVIPDQGALL